MHAFLFASNSNPDPEANNSASGSAAPPVGKGGSEMMATFL